MTLENRIAFVTGGGRGIGRAIALRLASEGATVAVSDLDGEEAAGVAEEIRAAGGKGGSCRLDAADEGEVEAVFAALLREHGRLDILVNCAGLCRNVAIEEISGEEWDRFLKVNLKSVFLCSRAAFRAMKPRRSGQIISLGSAAGKTGGAVAGAHYAAAKAGVICFTRSLALQAAPFDIQVNAIAPGPIATRMTAEWGEALTEAFLARIPLHRYGTPEEVAEVALLLASGRVGFMTGETINLNGGILMD